MTEENIKKILPIGSACYYPEGILDPHELFLFMHEDIEQVHFMGMQDADERGFCQFMEERLKELNMLKSA